MLGCVVLITACLTSPLHLISRERGRQNQATGVPCPAPSERTAGAAAGPAVSPRTPATLEQGAEAAMRCPMGVCKAGLSRRTGGTGARGKRMAVTGAGANIAAGAAAGAAPLSLLGGGSFTSLFGVGLVDSAREKTKRAQWLGDPHLFETGAITRLTPL